MISQDRSRTEHDSFGDIEVPAGALWGAQTERARRNFAGIGGGPLPADFIAAIALIKAAAAKANARLGLLPADVARAIQAADRKTASPSENETRAPPVKAIRAAPRTLPGSFDARALAIHLRPATSNPPGPMFPII